MQLARSVLVALALVFVAGFALPVAFERIACERLSLAVCSYSPYPLIVDFVSENRKACVAVAVLYALAVVAVYRGQLLPALRVGRPLRLAAGAVVLLVLAALVAGVWAALDP